MDQSVSPQMPNEPSSNDRVRNILFVLATLAAAFAILTVISIERIKNYIENQDGEWSYEYSYGDYDTEDVDDVVLEGDIDASRTEDEVINNEPLVIPEYIGYGGVPSPDVDETWLSNDLQAWWDANPEGLCTSLAPYVASEDLAPYSGYPTGLSLQNKYVQAALFDYLDVSEDKRKYASTALQNAVSEDSLIVGVCEGASTGVFLETMVADSRIAVVYSMFVNDAGMFRIIPYQPVAGLMDGYEFIPDNGRGEALIGTGYGDAGFISWKYYKLNPDLMTSELVEKCDGGPDFDEDDNYIEGSWELVCGVEYSI